LAAEPDDEMVESPDPERSSGLNNRFGGLLSQRGPLIIAIGASVAFLVLLCLFGYLLLRSDESGEPTPTPPINVAEIELDTDVFPFQTISDSGAISQTLETPIFVEIAGNQFSVQAEVLSAADPWTPPIVNETTAAWVYGSVINYIFGLDNTKDNQTLLEELDEGDEVVLTTRSGAKSTFTVSSRREVASDDRDIFAQRSPGITILLIEEDSEETRIVVQGRYVLSDTKDDSKAGQIVEMGQTAQLESLQVTATGVATQYDRPEAPPGFAFLQIDAQVQNVGTAAYNTSSLNMVLADDIGNLYALNPTASQLGNYPPLSGSVSPGQTILTTSGFQIPAGLSSPVLHWRITIAGSNSAIQIDIPFRDTSAAAQQALIEVQEVTISPDGGSMLVVGQIVNAGEQIFLIDSGDVSLTSSPGTIFQMLSTNPGFPWSIPPDQTLLYGVTFQRPIGSDAIFTIDGQSFQITGLR
jgi:hypothetical protein